MRPVLGTNNMMYWQKAKLKEDEKSLQISDFTELKSGRQTIMMSVDPILCQLNWQRDLVVTNLADRDLG